MSSGAEVRSLYLRLLQAWNDRDAAGMAECFGVDGLMIGFDGSIADGRENIQAHLSPIFADHPTASYVAIIRSIREAGPVWILLADSGMVPPGASEPNPEAMARQTVIAKMAEGDLLRIALFQNTPTALHWDEAARDALAAELKASFQGRDSSSE